MFPLYTEVYTEDKIGDNKTQKLLYIEERPVEAAAIQFYGASSIYINRSKQQCILIYYFDVRIRGL
jgi:hypothetical protein